MTRYTLLLALCACGGVAPNDKGSASLSDGGSTLTEGGIRDVSLRINVLPSRLRESNDADAAYVALPQTVILPPTSVGEEFSVGDVDLRTPVVQTGSVLAFKVNPSVSAVPGEDVPVLASIRLRIPDTVQTYAARTDNLGLFAMWAVPDDGYRLEIVPDDPLLPMSTDFFSARDPVVPKDLDLGPGVPIYGRVSSAAGEVAGARIHVVDSFGAVSSTAVSDHLGLYQIRVMAGTWTVVCDGRDSGTDPTLTIADQVVGDTGLNLDIAYPTDLAPAFIQGEVEDLDGQPLINATVRLTARSLTGYEDIDGVVASWTTEVYVGSTTGFLSPIVPGVYTIEALPPETADGDDLSPAVIESIEVGTGNTVLEPVQLGPLVTITGDVRDVVGTRLGSARVTCREIGFDERSSEVFSGDQGHFTIDLPTVPVSCAVHPPPDRPDLATAWAVVDPSTQTSFDFELSPGRLVTGRVVSNGVPEPYVVVDVRDESDRLLGTGLTVENGRFTVPVDLGNSD